MNSHMVPLAFATNSLRDIHEVSSRSPAEDGCFAELKEVLRRHGLEKKYGITLLHKHFDLRDDEILVEHTDIGQRTLVSKPMKVGSVPTQNLIEVTWSLDNDLVVGNCRSHCYYDWTMVRHETRHTAEGYSPLDESWGSGH
jgi:hypothetical protein